MMIDPQREPLEGVVEVDQTEIPFRTDNSFFDSQSQVAEPFVWTVGGSPAPRRGATSQRLVIPGTSDCSVKW
jgi:hypothetical protein